MFGGIKVQLRDESKFMSDPPAQFDGVFRWDYLNNAFKEATGRNIQFMDIDAHVEVGGHHLVFETKDSGVPIKDGQRQALLQLWAKGYTTVVFLWGKSDPMECEVFYASGNRSKMSKRQCTKDNLYSLCRRWAEWANNNPQPFQYGPSLDHPK